MSATGLTYNGMLSPLTYLREKKTDEKEAAAILQELKDNREKVYKRASLALEFKNSGLNRRKEH